MTNTDIKIIKLKDGRNYSKRLDRRRYFYPDEWKKFIKEVREPNKTLFEFMFNTGSRFDEAVHIRPKDFGFEENRKNVRLWKTKTKARKKEASGKPRTISLSTQFFKQMKRFCKNKKDDEYIFTSPSGKQMLLSPANRLLKRILKKVGIKDYYNFSTHNIRKTHGMYLKAIGVEIGELCQRLGHDYNTYIQHYGSADIFSERDIILIREMLGDLYSRQRRF